MNNTTKAIVIIIVIILLYSLFRYTRIEGMVSDGGALIQLNAKGPMDTYLTGDNNAFSYFVRPRKTEQYYNYYYPYYYPIIYRTLP
jgi:hypothetical protein